MPLQKQYKKDASSAVFPTQSGSTVQLTFSYLPALTVYEMLTLLHW